MSGPQGEGGAAPLVREDALVAVPGLALLRGRLVHLHRGDIAEISARFRDSSSLGSPKLLRMVEIILLFGCQ